MSLKEHAQSLRKNMTREERHLWYDFLKSFPRQFKRQKPIGPYIVDFYCPQAKLVVELDGSQHFEDKGKAYDTERDLYLKSQGLTVLRYSNADVNQRFPSVCQDIMKHLNMEL